jgi:hypothetical protein
VHIGSRQRDPFAGEQRRPDARFLAVIGRRSQANNRLALAGSGGAAVEIWLRGDAAIELAVELVGADLSGEIDDQSLGQRGHAIVLRHHFRIGHVFDRHELEQRIVMDEFVEPARANAEARDDLARMQRLVTSSDHALLDEIEHGIGDDVRVNAEVLAVMQVLQRLVGNAPKIDVQRRAVVYDLRDIAGDALANRIGGLVRVFDQRSLGEDNAIDPVDVKEGVAERPRHERIHLGDNGLGVAQHAHRDIDRDAEADEAIGVWRRHLHEGDICLDAAVRRQMRDLGKRDRHILGLPAANERACVGADEEAPMAVGRPLIDPERLQARCQEIEELDVGRNWLPPLKRLNQADWCRASRTDKHPVARLDCLDGSLGRAQSVGNQRELRPVVACP